jgi:hypothetical protein
VEGQGEGSFLLEKLVRILDEEGVTVVNGVNPYGSMDLEDLERFYGRYGFESFADGMMIRLPRGSRLPPADRAAPGTKAGAVRILPGRRTHRA